MLLKPHLETTRLSSGTRTRIRTAREALAIELDMTSLQMQMKLRRNDTGRRVVRSSAARYLADIACYRNSQTGTPPAMLSLR